MRETAKDCRGYVPRCLTEADQWAVKARRAVEENDWDAVRLYTLKLRVSAEAARYYAHQERWRPEVDEVVEAKS